jgi:predicted metal-binding protein
MLEKKSILSVCISCRDNRESKYKVRGGKRFSRILHKSIRKKNLLLREVKCMSQCKRACIVSLTAQDSFTYIFGDVDPNQTKYAQELLELVSIYSKANEGFMRRRDRPDLFRSNILGRLPPIDSTSDLVNNINKL